MELFLLDVPILRRMVVSNIAKGHYEDIASHPSKPYDDAALLCGINYSHMGIRASNLVCCDPYHLSFFLLIK